MRIRTTGLFSAIVVLSFLVACSERKTADARAGADAAVDVVPEVLARADSVFLETRIDAASPDAPFPPGADAAPEDLETNLDGIDWSDSDGIFDAIVFLEDAGGQHAIDALGLILVRTEDPMARVEAIDALAFLGDDGEVTPHLAAALEDASPDVRMEAADVIAELYLGELLTDLRRRLVVENDPEVLEALEEAIFDLEEERETRWFD